MPIRISSAINGFRRAGVAHPSKPTVYPDDYFSAQQVAQLVAEPRLAVEFMSEEFLDPADPAVPSEGAVEPDSVSDGVTDSDLDDAVEQDDAPQTPDESNDQVDRDDAAESDSTPAAVTEGHIDGVVEPDGTQKSLEEMDEEDVRQLGKDLGIRSYHNMGLDKLIEKIRAEKVQVPAEGEA